MGGVDVGGGNSKRAMNAEVNMIPFIDLLLVTVAFLLITAVWVTNSRINANAQVPGPPDPTKEQIPKPPEKILNVHVEPEEFVLTWRQGSVVAAERKVPRVRTDGSPDYSTLGAEFQKDWDQHGSHKNVDDDMPDQAVLHVRDNTPFKEIVAVLDALYTPKREMKIEDEVKNVPVFNMTFSIR